MTKTHTDDLYDALNHGIDLEDINDLPEPLARGNTWMVLLHEEPHDGEHTVEYLTEFLNDGADSAFEHADNLNDLLAGNDEARASVRRVSAIENRERQADRDR